MRNAPLTSLEFVNATFSSCRLVLSRRVKEMEQAGVHGMVEQLQREIQAYELARIQHSIHILRDELQGIEAAKLPSVIQKTLDVLEEVTHVLQPVSGS